MKVNIPINNLKSFAKKWKILKIFVFGSVLRDDFDELKSDIDIMIDFQAGCEWTLFDHVAMKEELEVIFSCSVDLLTKRAVEKSLNEFRKQEILRTAEIIYDSAA